MTGPTSDGIPDGFTREELEAAGYVGWRTWADLRSAKLVEIPSVPGCYVIFRSSLDNPAYLTHNPGGQFKAKDPTVPTERMAEEWIAGAHVVYIGKANELRTRLRAYARFGAGEPVAHWGGRLIWQLADSAQLLVAWRPLSSPGTARDLERQLLARFAKVHDGRRPLANLTG